MLTTPNTTKLDPALAQLLSVISGGRDNAPKQLREGVFQISSFSGDALFGIKKFEHKYPGLPDGPARGKYGNTSRNCYGVADDVDQVLSYIEPAVADPVRKFFVTVTEVRRDEQPEDGGWRWHKWGEYIGKREPTCEYLHDEKGIDAVLCFHVYEVAP